MNRLKIRVRNDLTGQDETFESDRGDIALIRDAKRILKEVVKQQTVFGLCLHITETMLTLHFYALDEKFASGVCGVASLVKQATYELREGKLVKSWLQLL
jgi:hypothetical protein